ncbi:programmed cell death protein 2-like [Dorcoceras hygrometricum]|uniref:Programmed cell death protein 2-like n=1 Tax=Dorcoceras hygrometricum TaxID=472368 RepID=A0A2Z7BDV4_9LAMI|nr:programmed cell death protein 2-like [Dorcoceras hygrometricum]
MEFELNGENLNSLLVSPFDEEEDEIQNNDTEDDITDEEEEQIPWTLGFVDKTKINGHCSASISPAWLDPVNLPLGKSNLCDFCGDPLQFLLQIYAPLPEELTFHRSLFVFMCPSMACLLLDQHEQWKRHPEKLLRSVKVFRCQLPRENPFYSSEAPNEDGTEQPLTAGATLCNWCGTWKGDKICSSCRRVHYCSGKHQVAHWRSSGLSHKVSCRQLETSTKSTELVVASNSLWPEYEITNEDECELDKEMSTDNDTARSLIPRTCGDDDKRSWAFFQERISLAPDQILRYSSDAKAKPLWPVSSGRPLKPDIPKCDYCGGTRGFEFQVLPQLLYYFHVKESEDSLDWATIVVYTCDASCRGNEAYKKEFAWCNNWNVTSHTVVLFVIFGTARRLLLVVYNLIFYSRLNQHSVDIHSYLLAIGSGLYKELYKSNLLGDILPIEEEGETVKVFRCQLPRENPFYSSEAPNEDGTEQPLTAGATLCNWCGTWKGDKICSSCRRVHYCSGKHQVAHWRSSGLSHKVSCRQLETSTKSTELVVASNSLWPEYEITNEDECELDKEMSTDNDTARSLIPRTCGDDDKRSWAFFQERISLAPDQILRYSSDAKAKPLWPVSSGRPLKPDIPKCNYCGGTRGFEFQLEALLFFDVQTSSVLNCSLLYDVLALFCSVLNYSIQLLFSTDFVMNYIAYLNCFQSILSTLNCSDMNCTCQLI